MGRYDDKVIAEKKKLEQAFKTSGQKAEAFKALHNLVGSARAAHVFDGSSVSRDVLDDVQSMKSHVEAEAKAKANSLGLKSRRQLRRGVCPK